MAESVNTRELILDILLDIEKNGQYSHAAVGNVLEKYQYLDKQDRAFISRMAEGTLECQIQLDYVIDQFSSMPVRKMKPVIRCILRSAVYQICRMDAVPDSAACNEAVKLAKKRGFWNLGGFVNGVLRNISRSRDNIRWPDRKQEPLAYLSVRYSMPAWIIQMWKEQFSMDWEKESGLERMERLLQAFSAPAPVTIRTDTSRCTPQQLKQMLEAEGIRASICAELPYALQIEGFDRLQQLPGFQEGLFYIQDISSMLAAEAAHPSEGSFVVDVCAAPGGKAIHIAQMLHGTGRVLARDLTEYKTGLLRENIRRCQAANLEVQTWDARILDETLLEKADAVIADLPCSGLGVLRRKKDIRYRMTPEKLEELAALQREILSVSCRYVKKGGCMVYSTCTVSRRENEDNVQQFLREHAEFELAQSRQILPGEGGGDGFYIARLLKNG